MNSKRKGKRGEIEWRDQLRAQGYTARRGQQYSGNPDAPDVVCKELDSRIHFEIKRVERLSLRDAMLQAIDDSGGKAPVVAHRINHGPWLVTMLSRDWFRLLREGLPAFPERTTQHPEHVCD